jgi:cell division protein FtsW
MRPFRHLDWMLLLATLLLMAVGLLMVPSSTGHFGSFSQELLRRVCTSLVILVVAFFLPLGLMRKLTLAALAVSLVWLVLVLILGREVKGARLAYLGFQPAEVLRFSLVLYLADFLERKRQYVRSLSRGLLPVLLILAVSFVLLALQPNWGVAITLSILTCVILVAGGVPVRKLLLVGTLAVVAVGPMLWFTPYTRRRIETWYRGYVNPEANNHSVRESLIAIGSGGIWGKGIGSGRQRFLLPEADSDFIYAILAEEWGLGGALLVLVLYGVVGWRGLLIAERAPNRYGLLLAFGLTASILAYALLNIAISLGIIPTTGLPLPFVSYGGSSLLFNAVGIGVLLNLSRDSSGSGKCWTGFRDENLDRRWRNRRPPDAGNRPG